MEASQAAREPSSDSEQHSMPSRPQADDLRPENPFTGTTARSKLRATGQLQVEKGGGHGVLLLSICTSQSRELQVLGSEG